jgi:hypothetical protein
MGSAFKIGRAQLPTSQSRRRDRIEKQTCLKAGRVRYSPGDSRADAGRRRRRAWGLNRSGTIDPNGHKGRLRKVVRCFLLRPPQPTTPADRPAPGNLAVLGHPRNGIIVPIMEEKRCDERLLQR